MKKTIKFIPALLVLAAAAAAFSLAACSSKNGLKADIFAANSQQNYPALETLDMTAGQKPQYDQAYDQAKSYFEPESPVRGAVMAATFQSKQELAGFFSRLEKNQHYQTIVLLIPTDLSKPISTQSSPQKANEAVGDYAYKTPYGIVSPPRDLLQKIHEDHSFKVDQSVAKREVWASMLAPFIAKSFPGSTFLPIYIDENSADSSSSTTAAEHEQFAEWLNNNLPQDSLVLAQTVSKTSADKNVAEFQLKFTENVLENFDESKFTTLPLNNAASVDVLEKYLTKRSAQRMQNQFMDPTNGNFISYSTDGPLYPSRSVFLVSFGDLMFDRVVRNLMDSHSLDYPFQKMDQSYLKSNDILIANLEGPIAKKRVVTSKTIAFRFNPDIVPLLQKYFFDALGEANNHAMDMGETGFNDTFDLLAPTGIKAFGDPRQIDDRSVATFDTRSSRLRPDAALSESGQKIAFLGLEEVVYKIDDAKAVAKIQELTSQGYKVIPFVHWGIEYQHKPNSRQQKLAHEFIDAGAIAVIGMHPHVVETYENYKNRPIFYSLGNAIFDQYFSPDTQEGLSIGMILSNDQIQIYLLPIKIDRSQFRLMTDDERKEFLQRFVTYGDYQTEAEREEIKNGKIEIKL